MSLVSPSVENIGFGFGDANVKLNGTSIGLLSGECAFAFGIEVTHDESGLVPIAVVMDSYVSAVKPTVAITWKEGLKFSVFEELYPNLLDYTAANKDVVVDPTGMTSGTRITPSTLEIEGLHVPISTLVESETIDDTPDGTTKSFSGTLTNIGMGILATGLEITATIGAAPKTITCDNMGILSGDTGNITGTLNKQTGAWTLTFTTAPDDTTDITADYYYYKDYQLEIMISKCVASNLGDLIQNPTAPVEPTLTFQVQYDEDNSTYPLGKLVKTAVT